MIKHLSLLLAVLSCSLAAGLAASTPLVNHGDAWRYHKGTNAPTANWKTVADGSLDATWGTGNGGFGYADNATETNNCQTLLADMLGSAATNYTTVYLRKQFTIGSALATNLHAFLRMDFDDGYIAWLDGTYLTNRYVTGAPTEPTNTAVASTSHESSTGNSTAQPAETNDLGQASLLLGVGTHTLAIIGLNNSKTSTDLIQVADLYLDVGATNPPASSNSISGTISVNTTLYASNSPYTVSASVTVNGSATLTIEPGTTLLFASGAGVTVSGGGRVLAEGTAAQHIHLTKTPTGGNWASFDFIGATNESRWAYIDIDSCGGATVGGHNAQVHVNGGSKVFFDHLVYPNSPVIEYISFDGSSFIVQNCTFPTYAGTTGPESVHGVNGINTGGYGIFRDNYFGHTWGFNDTIDFTGGNRPGPILQIVNNVFDGASDDNLDLDSTDAWIEGNIFMHVHRDPTRTDNALDTGSAISGGVDFVGQNSDWTIINNLFYDVDHVFLNKGNSTTTPNGGGRIAFLYNTVIHVAKEYSGSTVAEIAVFDWSDDDIIAPAAGIGSGMYAAYNIIYDAAVLQKFYYPTSHTDIFDHNIFPVSFAGTTNEWTGAGSGNQYVDPLLNLGVLAGTAPTNVTPAQLRQAAQLLPGSPAIGAGFGGLNLGGGFQPHGIVITGEPATRTTNTSATLTLGLGGTFNWGTNAVQPWGWTAFKWKLDNGTWSAEITVTNNSPFTNPPSIRLTGLSNGTHTVYVVGKNDAGYYQDDTFVYPAAAGIPAAVTASRTWTVTDDTDGDGMPDAWEIAHGLNPNVNDAGLDADIDGMTNLQEYLAGTDPQNKNSFLKVDTELSNGGGFELTFAAVSNKTYTVQSREILGSGNWSNLVNFAATPTNRVQQWTDTTATNEALRYYRIVTPTAP